VIYVPPSIADLPPQGQPAPTREAAVPAPRAALAILTPRQRGVLELLVQGKSNKAIARDLDLGEGTVKVHMAALFRSLGVRTRTAAAVAGGRLLQPES
jgi:DNA-binding NarL/FixJ family response regulator